MSRIVVDTSVLISALIGKAGLSRQVLRKCLLGEFKPIVSTTLFLEYEDVSNRPRVKKLCPLKPGEINDLLAAFISVCDWVSIHYLWRPNLRDEGDNFLIELAVAGNAQIVVTNNTRDLSGAQLTFESFRVMKPEQVLRGL